MLISIVLSSVEVTAVPQRLVTLGCALGWCSSHIPWSHVALNYDQQWSWPPARVISNRLSQNLMALGAGIIRVPVTP